MTIDISNEPMTREQMVKSMQRIGEVYTEGLIEAAQHGPEEVRAYVDAANGGAMQVIAWALCTLVRLAADIRDGKVGPEVEE